VLAHALAAVLVFMLLATMTSVSAAAVGGILFAIHPIHTEAVANVMGRAEIFAGVAYIAACLVYLRWTPRLPGHRAGRLLVLGALFLCSVGSKEIGVTLPATLMLLEVFRSDDEPLRARLSREGLTYLGIFALLGCYVVVRWSVLGTATGTSVQAGLVSLDTGGRLFSALSVWPEYLRLMVFPADLAAEYGPAVLIPTSAITFEVLFGAGLLIATVFGAIRLRVSEPLIAMGLAWFVIAISPVSNLIVASDVLLAERTLYLPSIGLAFVCAGVAARVLREPGRATRRAASVVGIVVAMLFLTRTVTRNPTWESSFTVLRTLAQEHPESWLGQRTLAISYRQVGDDASAAESFEVALALAPDHYQLLVDAADFYEEVGDPVRSEELLRQAIHLLPEHPVAYARLADDRIARGDGRGAHAAALQGVAQARPDREVWALVSESYVMKADLEAAVRAREASIGIDATSAGWLRLGELLDALGRPDAAEDARASARLIREGGPS
jgi:tetratricopeptide (TPR) repeat protein